ncbi:hypothetical protein G4B88_027546 [Cannabis sativa]|uniref:Rab-GAP TBC domain-containing protein n=1 Tax=Cannabis sativa TaxID=3483 RepID=A0A7J6G675_CANSA|nr:hypothetical protein G4B88_027546 [Cannabis sativa]
MKNSSNHSYREEDQPKKESPISTMDSRFNQTLRNVQGLLKGRTIPGKILLTRRSDPIDDLSSQENSPSYQRSFSSNDAGTSDRMEKAEENQTPSKPNSNANASKLKSSTSQPEIAVKEIQKSTMGARATDSARLTKFSKVLSGTTIILEKLRELAWSGVPPYMRPNVWRLLLVLGIIFTSFADSLSGLEDDLINSENKVYQKRRMIPYAWVSWINITHNDTICSYHFTSVRAYGYAPPNSDRRDGVLRRKRLEYLDCVSQYYDIPDTERSDDEINMLRQLIVQELYRMSLFFNKRKFKNPWSVAIRHPASGYVQGINDLVTPFLVVFLSEYLEGSVESWLISDLSPDKLSDIEADCYWCLSKLLDGMQDHYTFAQPGIQRLVFKLKELVRRIDEPVSKHVEEQGLEFLQFAFRWFNCLLIREIPFHLVTRLWDTYLAEGDALPDFLVYIFASFLLTWSDELQKLDFQELVMFLQHLPTQNWTHQELEMVLSRAYMWHSMFNSSPSHLAS